MLKTNKRFVIMILALLALLAAMWSGLVRIGWSIPSFQKFLPIAHGPLMISGFLGTLIGLERAVALSLTNKSPLLYLGPILSGLGGVFLIVGLPGLIGSVLITLGSLGLTIIFLLLFYRHSELFTAVIFLGSLSWLIGNILWLFNRSIPQVVWWWAGFLILTIVGERLELSRMIRVSNIQKIIFGIITTLHFTGLVTSIFSHRSGVLVTGVSMVLFAIWLFQNDIARRTVRKTGLPRFTAICLLSGYIWLVIGGVLAILFGGETAGLHYDAILHSIFLGFTFAMIFGHAPIIFPSVLGRPIFYRPTFYVPLLLLHLTLLLRVLSDLISWIPGRRWGGLLNVIVLLFFLVNTAYTLRQSSNISPSSANIS